MEDNNDDRDVDNADDQIGDGQYANDANPSPSDRKDTDDDAFVDISKDAHDYQSKKKQDYEDLPKLATREKAPTAQVVPT